MLIAYRSDIDGLRAVAILSVIAFHAKPHLIPGGFTGVDIFFVISGFLITRIILTENAAGTFSFGYFWIRRAKRILPALLFMLVCVTAAAFYLLIPVDLKTFGSLLKHGVLFAANIYLAREGGYFAPDDQTNPLLHIWSLAVEEQFYLFWPVILIAGTRFLRPARLAVGLAVLFSLSLAYSAWAIEEAPKLAFYSLSSRAFELLVGAAIGAMISQPPKSRIVANILSAAGLSFIALSTLTFSERTPFPGFAALLPCLGAALLIVSGGGSNQTLGERLLSTPLLVWIGRISYSWYLWHWPPLAFARYYLDRPPTGPELLAVLAFGMAMAILSWVVVERPFRKPIAIPNLKRQFIPAACALSVLLLSAGIAFKALKGIPQRLEPETHAVLEHFQLSKSIGCIDEMRRTDKTFECTFGASHDGPPTMLLWGDSHAHHYLPAIASIAAAHGIKGVARLTLGCTPYIEPTSIRVKDEFGKACGPANADTISRLLSRPEISTVILAARWSRSETESFPEERDRIFKMNLERTISSVMGQGKRLIILDQVPELHFSPDRCFLKKERFKLSQIKCNKIPVSTIPKQQIAAWRAIEEVRQKYSNAIFFSPQRVLCDDATCRVADQNGISLYYDTNHLNVNGANYLTPHIARSLGTQFLSSLSR